jgi:hypothetical protein
MIAARFTPVFSAAFALIYCVAEQFNIALVTYHPRLREWGWLTEAPRNGPSMYWFGWVGTAALGALAVAILSLPLTRNRAPQWIGWAVPLAIMVAFVYLLRAFFLR